MPKRSEKAKEKKLRRKQEQAEVAVAWAKVKAAYEMGDFMLYFSPFKTYSRNGLDLDITYAKASALAEGDLKWAFQLMKDNMKSLYVQGGWGWNDREKWEEMTHDASCFLIARERTTRAPVGFTSFRFDLDDNVEVVYCYEIQVEDSVRRKGLGKFLIQLLELIGHKTDMKKVVLTVFKENPASNKFFRDRLGFDEDATSPSLCDPYNADTYSYSILSKPLVKPAGQCSKKN